MGTGTGHLRDRMVRDAVVEVLRGLGAAGDDPAGPALSPIQQVEVRGEHVEVAIVLREGWRPAAGVLVSDVVRRLQSVAEIDRSTSTWSGPDRGHRTSRQPRKEQR